MNIIQCILHISFANLHLLKQRLSQAELEPDPVRRAELIKNLRQCIATVEADIDQTLKEI